MVCSGFRGWFRDFCCCWELVGGGLGQIQNELGRVHPAGVIFFHSWLPAAGAEGGLPGPHSGSFRPKFERGENLKRSIDWRTPPAETSHPQMRRTEDEDGGAGARTSLSVALGRAGRGQPASRSPLRGFSPVLSAVPAAPDPAVPRAQPQMSSHNSRLAADSYKNCVWTISGEAPEFRAPASCGVPLRSSEAPGPDLRSCASE